MNGATLIRIGKLVSIKYPQIARELANQVEVDTSLRELIVNEWQRFCIKSEIDTKKDGERSELRKVFVCLFIQEHGKPFRLVKYLAQVFSINHALSSRIVKEIEFRYKKDLDFKTKVQSYEN